MSSEYTIKWEEVENSVNDRMRDDSLLHTLSSMKRIRKQTKIFNRKLKKFHHLRNYKQFVKLRKVVRKTCKDEDETDDEPGLTYEEYKEIHQTKLKADERQTVKHSDHNDLHYQLRSRGKKSISHSHDLQSTLLSSTESQSSKTKLPDNEKTIASLDNEDDNCCDIQRVDNDVKDLVHKIVKDLMASDIEEECDDDLLEFNFQKVEDNVVAANWSEKRSLNEPRRGAANEEESIELKEKSEVFNDHDYGDSNSHAESSSPALGCMEISSKHNSRSQENIFMTNDDEIDLGASSSDRNYEDKFTDTLNHDSGNNSLSDMEDSIEENGNVGSYDNAVENYELDKGIVPEHCLRLNKKDPNLPAGILELEDNAYHYVNEIESCASLNTESSISQMELRLDDTIEDVRLSNNSLNSNASEEITLAEPIRILQLHQEVSVERTNSNSGNKVKIRTIEHYDKEYEIFSKYQLSKKFVEQLPPKDKRSLRSRKLSEDCNLSQDEMYQFRLHKESSIKKLSRTTGEAELTLSDCEHKSSKTISHESQPDKNKDVPLDKNKSDFNTSKNVQRTRQRTPRPRNLKELVAAEALTQDTTKPHFRLKDIDDGDEIWIMNVPKTIDPNDLENRMILLGGNCELKIGDDDYKVSSKPSKGNCNFSCVFATNRRKKEYKIVNIESKGYVKFRRRFTVTPVTEFIPSEKLPTVPFPKGLKIRHPLFGATYKDKI